MLQCLLLSDVSFYHRADALHGKMYLKVVPFFGRGRGGIVAVARDVELLFIYLYLLCYSGTFDLCSL